MAETPNINTTPKDNGHTGPPKEKEEEEDKKPAAKELQSISTFYAIRKSDALKTPAIFLCWEDCSFYIDKDEKEPTPSEYQEFETLDEATEYIRSYIVVVGLNNKEATICTNKKRSAQAASLPSSARRKKRQSLIIARSQEMTTQASKMSLIPGTAVPAKLITEALVQGGAIAQSKPTNEQKTFGERQKKIWKSQWMTKYQQAWIDTVDENLEQLKKYVEKYGNSNVPTRSPKLEEEFIPLSKWIKKTQQYIKGYQEDSETSFLTEEQVQKLLDSGFPLNATRGTKPARIKRQQELEETWDDMIEKLKNYKGKYGTCDVPKRSRVMEEEFLPLGKWVHKMREFIKQHEEDPESSILDEPRIQVLMDIGFVKNTTRGSKVQSTAGEEEAFELHLAMLKETLDVKKPVRNNQKLQNWIHKQRKEYSHFKDGIPSTMTPQRLARLAEAGFSFQAKQKLTWEARAGAWLEFRSKNGVDPKRYSEDGLGKWVSNQRSKHASLQEGKKTNLTQDQIKRLTDWGFTWESKIKKPLKRADPLPWAERFKQLLKYKEEHGHTLVPQHYPELGQWVHGQRNDYRKFVRGQKCKMTAEKLGKLNELGFVFYTGKGGGKRTRQSVAQRKQPDDSEEEDDEEEVEDEEPPARGRLTYQQQHFSQSSVSLEPAFAPWDRYHMGRH
jgi:hypothetical protein